MNEELITVWNSKIMKANNQYLTSFLFQFENSYYISCWVKNKWEEPQQIKLL